MRREGGMVGRSLIKRRLVARISGFEILGLYDQRLPLWVKGMTIFDLPFLEHAFVHEVGG